MASTAGKANWNAKPRRKPRPVAKQLESPVDAAARGPKGTEILKGPGGSLGSVRRNCVHGLHSWKGQQANKQLQPSLVESLDQWPSSCGKPSGSCSEGSEGFEGARRQSRKRKKELCARLQQLRPVGFARGGPQLE